MTATAQVSRMIPARADRVWETLTSKDGMRAYMMGSDVATDWKVGSPIVMKGEVGGKSFEDRGEVRSFEPWKQFSYTHNSGGQEHLVTFELHPQGEAATQVVIIQANTNGEVTDADREHQAQYEQTWAAMLEGVEKAVGH